MKEKKPFFIEFAVGILLIVTGLATRWDYYSNLIFAMGCGMAFGSLFQLLRLVYWQSPKRQTEYEEKKREARIDRIDERKQYLRMKAGYITYQITAFALLILALIFSLFRAEAWVIGMLFLLFLFEWAAGVIVFRVLEKRI